MDKNFFLVLFMWSMVSVSATTLTYVALTSVEQGAFKRLAARVREGRAGVERLALPDVMKAAERRWSPASAFAPTHAAAAHALLPLLRQTHPDAVPPLLMCVAVRMDSELWWDDAAWKGMASLRLTLGDNDAAAFIDLLVSLRGTLARGAARVELSGEAEELLHRTAEWAGVEIPAHSWSVQVVRVGLREEAHGPARFGA